MIIEYPKHWSSEYQAVLQLQDTLILAAAKKGNVPLFAETRLSGATCFKIMRRPLHCQVCLLRSGR